MAALDLILGGFQLMRKAYKMASEARKNLDLVREELREMESSLEELEGAMRDPVLVRILSQRDPKVKAGLMDISATARRVHRAKARKFEPIERQLDAVCGSVMGIQRAASIVMGSTKMFATAAMTSIEAVLRRIEVRRSQVRDMATTLKRQGNEELTKAKRGATALGSKAEDAKAKARAGLDNARARVDGIRGELERAKADASAQLGETRGPSPAAGTKAVAALEKKLAAAEQTLAAAEQTSEKSLATAERAARGAVDDASDEAKARAVAVAEQQLERMKAMLPAFEGPERQLRELKGVLQMIGEVVGRAEAGGDREPLDELPSPSSEAKAGKGRGGGDGGGGPTSDLARKLRDAKAAERAKLLAGVAAEQASARLDAGGDGALCASDLVNHPAGALIPGVLAAQFVAVVGGDAGSLDRPALAAAFAEVGDAPMLEVAALLGLLADLAEACAGGCDAAAAHLKAVKLSMESVATMVRPLATSALGVAVALVVLETAERREVEFAAAGEVLSLDDGCPEVEAVAEFALDLKDCVERGALPSAVTLLDLSCAAAGGGKNSVGASLRNRLMLLRSIVALSAVEVDVADIDRVDRRLAKALRRVADLRAAPDQPGSVRDSFGERYADSDAACFWLEEFGPRVHEVKWTRFARAFHDRYRSDVAPHDVRGVVARLKLNVCKDEASPTGTSHTVHLESIRNLAKVAAVVEEHYRAVEKQRSAAKQKLRVLAASPHKSARHFANDHDSHPEVGAPPPWYSCTHVTARQFKSVSKAVADLAGAGARPGLVRAYTSPTEPYGGFYEAQQAH